VNFGGRQFQYNNTNELVSVSPGGVTPFQGTTNKAVQSASVASNVISVTQTQPNPTTYSTPQYSSATESVEFSWPNNGNSTALVYGTVTVGDVVSFIISNSALPAGQEQPSYTVQSGDTVDSIAAGLADAINADANLAALGITASSSSANVSIQQPYTTYYWYNSSGATEYLSLGPTNSGNIEITVSGTPTAGDTLTITATNGAMSGGESSVTYTVLSGDTLNSIAAALAAAVNANTGFSGVGIAAVNGSPAVLKWSQAFSANTPISSYSPIELSATDGGGNSASTDYTMYVGGSTSFPAYDFNGNMTSDGTNSYQWDADNRLIQITYPGDGNNSQFTYDGLNCCVQIIETIGGTITSTKQFVQSDNRVCEARDGSGSIVNQYFSQGETITGSGYFYTKDHLGSIAQVVDASGNVQASYCYDSFGRVSQLQGSLNSDFLYAGYYAHAPSGLSFCKHRFYSSSLGRWMSRDPVGEKGGQNLYEYAFNQPTTLTDPSGTSPSPLGPTIPYLIEPWYLIFTIGPWEAAEAGSAGIWAMVETKKQFGDNDKDPRNNAYIHCLLACRLKQLLGYKDARFVLGEHEVFDFLKGIDPIDDTVHDFANDIVGMEIGQANGTPEDCKKGCMCAIHSGYLYGTNLRTLPPSP
jgi:RHS repeat-associated protein